MILSWYIFKQTFKNLFISTCVFVGIIWLTQSFKSIKLIINKGAGLLEFFIADLTPGLAFPAAQPQTELTSTSTVPFSVLKSCSTSSWYILYPSS